MKNKQNILITGVNGFIGKNLKEYFKDKHNLFTPSRKELNLLDEKEVEIFFIKNNVDIVINAALVGGSRAEEAEESALNQNLRMFFNLVSNSDKFKKMIHCGSGAEYDKRFPIVKVKEEDFGKKIPIDDYGFGKYVCSKYIENSKKIVCLRIFGLFGKHEDYRYRFISNAICRNIYDLPIIMKKNVYFDYVYVADFIRIIEYFIEHKAKHKFYNVGAGKSIDIKTIAEKVNKIADNKSKIIIKEKGLANEYTCDNKRLLDEIKGFKFKDFDVCIKELYLWYKKNKEFIKKDLL